MHVHKNISTVIKHFQSMVGLHPRFLFSSIKPGTHWRQSRQSSKPATNLRQSRLSTSSPIYVCRKSTVVGSFSLVDCVAVDIVAKAEHVQLGWLCRKWVIFVSRMSNVLSTLSPVCTGLYRSFEDRTRVPYHHTVSFCLLGGRLKTTAWPSKPWQMNWCRSTTKWNAISTCLDGAKRRTELTMYNESVCCSAGIRVITPVPGQQWPDPTRS